MRRFQPGQSGELNGIDWRVVQGKKARDDRRLDLSTSGWRSVPMSLGFLLADFFVENENVLYPPSPTRRGGEMYMDFCRGSVLVGWEASHEYILGQRARKAGEAA